MIDNIELFNKKLLEFAEDLIFLCPEVNNFRIFRDTSIAAIKLDKGFARGLFHICVYEPYYDQVMNKDESFFLRESFKEYDRFLEEWQQDMNLVQQIKKIWLDLDDKNKETIWTYLRVLLALNKKCIESSWHGLQGT